MAVFDIECTNCGYKFIRNITHDMPLRFYKHRYFCGFCGMDMRTKREDGSTIGRVIVSRQSKFAELLTCMNEIVGK